MDIVIGIVVIVVFFGFVIKKLRDNSHKGSDGSGGNGVGSDQPDRDSDSRKDT